MLLCVGCIAAAYLLAGFTVILPSILLLAMLSVGVCRKSHFWGASTALIGVVVLAGIGVSEDFSVDLLLIGVVMGLVGWDVLLLGDEPPEDGRSPKVALRETYHFRLLAVAVGAGVLLAALASHVDFDLPFTAVAALSVFVVGGIGLGLRLYIRDEL